MAGHRGVGRLQWWLKELTQTLWVRVTAFAILGLLTAALGYVLRGQIPDTLAGKIGADAIEPILQIVASSMLTVTTFSLSILTAGYATAGSGSSPKVVGLLVRDGVSQTVLATFIGAFVFSLVGLIMLKTQLYGDGGRVVLFISTLLVIFIVILSLLRWINRLGQLGLIGDNLTRVREATSRALHTRLQSPWMGANPLDGPPPEHSVPIMATTVGYVQNLDMRALSDLADTAGLTVFITATPGDFVHPACPLLHVANLPTDADDLCKRLAGCFTVNVQRSFDQDPRYGFLVLSEIGQRASSSAINDAGTTISVIQTILAVLSDWKQVASPAVEFPRLHVHSITAIQILGDSLMPIARDSAALIEVHRALQHCLLALTQIAPDVYAKATSELTCSFLDHALEALVLEREKIDLTGLSGQVAAAALKVVPAGQRNNLWMK